MKHWLTEATEFITDMDSKVAEIIQEYGQGSEIKLAEALNEELERQGKGGARVEDNILIQLAVNGQGEYTTVESCEEILDSFGGEKSASYSAKVKTMAYKIDICNNIFEAVGDVMNDAVDKLMEMLKASTEVNELFSLDSAELVESSLTKLVEVRDLEKEKKQVKIGEELDVIVYREDGIMKYFVIVPNEDEEPKWAVELVFES